MTASNYSTSFVATAGPKPAGMTRLRNGDCDGLYWVRGYHYSAHEWEGGFVTPQEADRAAVVMLNTYYVPKWSEDLMGIVQWGKRYWRFNENSYRAGRWILIPEGAYVSIEPVPSDDDEAPPAEAPVSRPVLFGRITSNLEIVPDGTEYQNESFEQGLYYFRPPVHSYNIFGYRDGIVQYIYPGYADGVDILSTPFNANYPKLGARQNVRWSIPLPGGVAGYTSLPCIMGPIMPQVDATVAQSPAPQRSGQNNGCGFSPTIQVYNPRPLDADGHDTLIVDDGKSVGRFLLGYRARFVKVRRYAEGIRQTEATSAAVVTRAELSYDKDITKRYLSKPPRKFTPFNSPAYYTFDTVFKYDTIETMATEPFRGWPAATLIDTIDGKAANAPYWMEPGEEIKTLNNGAVMPNYSAGNPEIETKTASDYGTYAVFNGTFVCETSYAFQPVFITRAADKSTVLSYGEETFSTIATMPRRMEPVGCLSRPDKYTLSGMIDSGRSYLRGQLPPAFAWQHSWKQGDPGTPPPPQGTFGTLNAGWDNALSANGFLIVEGWDGPRAETDPVFGQTQGGFAEYPGYYYSGPPYDPAKLLLPPVPYSWQTYRNAEGNSMALTVWGRAFTYIYHRHLPTGEYQSNGGAINGAYPSLFGWTRFKPGDNGGSVAYPMPPPNAKNTGQYGLVSVYPNGSWKAQDGANAGDYLPMRNLESYYYFDQFTGALVTDTEPIKLFGFYGDTQVVPPTPPPPTLEPGYLYYTGGIQLWLSDEAGPFAYDEIGAKKYAFKLDDGKTAYWFVDSGKKLFYVTSGPNLGNLYEAEPPFGTGWVGFDSNKEIHIDSGPFHAYLQAYAGPHTAAGPKRFFICSNHDINSSVILNNEDLSSRVIVDHTKVNLGVASPEIGRVGVLVLHGDQGDIAVRIYDRPQRYRPVP